MTEEEVKEIISAKAAAVDQMGDEGIRPACIVYISQSAPHLYEREFKTLNEALLDMNTRGQPLYSRLEKWYVTEDYRFVVKVYDQTERVELLKTHKEEAEKEAAQKVEDSERELYVKLRTKFGPEQNP